jgi:hypothetical protein
MMDMLKGNRRTGMSLVLAGLLAILFFWLSDPRWGIRGKGRSSDFIDAIAQASPGTYVGIIGGIVIAVIGLWLMMRRTA